MKAILEFDLPEDKDLFTLANYGSEFYFLLTNYDNDLRSIIKYEDDEEKAKYAEMFREMLHSYLADMGLSLQMVN